MADLVHNRVERSSGIAAAIFHTVPYNVANISAYTKSFFNKNAQIEIFKYADDLIEAVKENPPNIIAFSHYIWNSHLNKSIGNYLKEKYPELLIVAGGPSIKTTHNEVKKFLEVNKYIDLCVINEGEAAFLNCVIAYEQGAKSFMDKKQIIPNVGYLSGGSLIFKAENKFVNLDNMPSPYLLGYLDKFLEEGLMPIFETNRGCPFKCTYCAWGKASQSKLRKMSLPKVLEEMEYVAYKYPQCEDWIIGDANFGILPRDIEIAHKINELRKNRPAIKSITFYESKNATMRTVEISSIIRESGSFEKKQQDFSLIALQTLDETAQKYTKRINIKLDDVPLKIQAFRDAGNEVRTDILSGLPGETFEGHMSTLRQCFDYGFDHIGIYNLILLPGTELETQESRNVYGIKTKFRLKDAFSQHLGIKSIEQEEVVCSNNAIAEAELLTLRCIHWYIWFGWNHGFFKPFFKYVHKNHGLNPVDIIYKVVTSTNLKNNLKASLDYFKENFNREFFDSPESLHEYCFNPSVWNKILNKGLFRTGFILNAKFIQDKELYKSALEALTNAVSTNKVEKDELKILSNLLLEKRIWPDDIYNANFKQKISLKLTQNIAEFFNIKNSNNICILNKSLNKQKTIEDKLKKHSYEVRPHMAIINALHSIPDAFEMKM
jgi:radical SAM superfamily enzyme YgiQ (UPF0313 family)